MTFIWPTFGFGVLSAVVPIFNMEAYVAWVASPKGYPGAPYFWVAFVGSLGQNLGKLVWYYAAGGALRIKWLQDKLDDPKRKASVERWRAQIEGRPFFSALLAFTSAATGIPPITAMAPVAGVLRMNVAIFFFAGLLGRTLFLWVVLLGAGAFFHLF